MGNVKMMVLTDGLCRWRRVQPYLGAVIRAGIVIHPVCSWDGHGPAPSPPVCCSVLSRAPAPIAGAIIPQNGKNMRLFRRLAPSEINWLRSASQHYRIVRGSFWEIREYPGQRENMTGQGKVGGRSMGKKQQMMNENMRICCLFIFFKNKHMQTVLERVFVNKWHIQWNINKEKWTVHKLFIKNL